MRKWVSLLLCLVLLTAVIPAGQAVEYTDATDFFFNDTATTEIYTSGSAGGDPCANGLVCKVENGKIAEVTYGPQVVYKMTSSYGFGYSTVYYFITVVSGLKPGKTKVSVWNVEETLQIWEGTVIVHTCEQAGHHHLEKHDRVEPTNKAEGTEEYWECTGCGKLFSDADGKKEISKPVVIPKLGPTKISKAVITLIPDQVYTGKAIKPKFTVSIKDVQLKQGTDYTVTWKNNKKIGKATITVTGKGDYTGSIKTTFIIKPKPVKLSSLKAGSKALTVKWKKGSGIDGYEIEYSLKSTFKSSKKITVKGAGTASKIIKKLKKGKTYYVRIRAFKKTGGKTYYSEWSAIKSKKVKK